MWTIDKTKVGVVVTTHSRICGLVQNYGFGVSLLQLIYSVVSVSGLQQGN